MSISQRPLRYLLLSFCVLAVFSQAALAQTRATQDTLWAKAVALAEANQNWMPTQWHEMETIFDKNGKVEETSEYLLHLGLTPDNNLDVQIIKAVKNGKDNLKEARKELEANADAYTRDDPEDNLFDPSIQHTVTATRSGEVKRINGRACAGFTYVQKTRAGTWAGTAWLDAETGMPVQVEATMRGLPMEEDGIEVTALTSITHFNVSAPDAWYPVKVVVDVGFNAKYAVFSFKGSSKTTITLSGYERI